MMTEPQYQFTFIIITQLPHSHNLSQNFEPGKEQNRQLTNIREIKSTLLRTNPSTGALKTLNALSNFSWKHLEYAIKRERYTTLVTCLLPLLCSSLSLPLHRHIN